MAFILLADLVAVRHSNERLVGFSISQRAYAKLGSNPCSLIVISFSAYGSPLVIRETMEIADPMA